MPRGTSQVRIIAGRWRGLKLSFPDIPGLRPTPDRIRETLFNWLAPGLPGASCLDLFAGSGALGFEAASRGAARVVLVERDARAVRGLRASRQRLNAPMIDIVRQDSLAYLHGPAQVFDVVFIDAPFTDTQTVQAALDRLTEGGWIESGARIYLETAVTSSQLLMPLGWELFRDKRAGQVSFRLYAYRPE